MGKTGGKVLGGAQEKGDGLEMQPEMHGDRPGVDQKVVVTDALAAVQVGQQVTMWQVGEKGLQQKTRLNY